MWPISLKKSNNGIQLTEESSKDALEVFCEQKGFNLRDFGSYIGDVISLSSGEGGWQGVYQSQTDFFQRLTDTLSTRKGTYSELASLTLQNPFGSACIRLIGESISSIKWDMIRSMPSGKKLISKDHALFRLFKDTGLYDIPGTKRTRLSLFEPIIHHLYFAGEVFIQLSNRKRVNLDDVEIGRAWYTFMPERPRTFTVIHPRHFRKFIMDPDDRVVGYEFHIVRRGKRKTIRCSTSEMLHVKRYNCEDEDRGQPMIVGAYTSLIQARMSARWNTNLSRTGGRIQGYFSPKGLKPGDELSPETVKNIENYLDETLRNRQDKNLPMVMSGAMEYLANTVTPREADFMDNDKLNGRKICAAIKVPSILAGDVDSQGLGGGSALKAAEKLLWRNCLLPILDDFIEEININVANRYEDGYFLEYDAKQIDALADDLDKKYQRLHRATGGPWQVPNETREQTGLSPRDDPEFEKLRLPKKTSERDDKRSDHERNNEGENPNERD